MLTENKGFCDLPFLRNDLPSGYSLCARDACSTVATVIAVFLLPPGNKRCVKLEEREGQGLRSFTSVARKFLCREGGGKPVALAVENIGKGWRTISIFWISNNRNKIFQLADVGWYTRTLINAILYYSFFLSPVKKKYISIFELFTFFIAPVEKKRERERQKRTGGVAVPVIVSRSSERDSSRTHTAKINPAFPCRRTPEIESATATEDGCSDGSEVDWSWLEEVDCLRAAEPFTAVGGERDEPGGRRSVSPTNGNTGRRRARDHHETEATRSVAMSVTVTAKPLAVGDSRWPSDGGALLERQNNNNNSRRNRRNGDSNNNNSEEDDSGGGGGGGEDDEAAARCNATNEAVDRGNREIVAATVTGSVAAAANSWMRASMRRLRHLRMPEGTLRRGNESANRRAAIVSAPNSLPDIALIAPEILAAQTNGGNSGTLLRPASAPARNATAAGVATPRRTGRQVSGGGRSRGARSREASSRQSSLGSTTTASDTTAASGITTCSSFGGASSSPPSSTTTSPQRMTSRR